MLVGETLSLPKEKRFRIFPLYNLRLRMQWVHLMISWGQAISKKSWNFLKTKISLTVVFLMSQTFFGCWRINPSLIQWSTYSEIEISSIEKSGCSVFFTKTLKPSKNILILSASTINKSYLHSWQFFSTSPTILEELINSKAQANQQLGT